MSTQKERKLNLDRVEKQLDLLNLKLEIDYRWWFRNHWNLKATLQFQIDNGVTQVGWFKSLSEVEDYVKIYKKQRCKI